MRYVLILANRIQAELFSRISSKFPLKESVRVWFFFFFFLSPFKKSFFGLQLGIEAWSFTSSILGIGSDYRNGRNEVDPNRVATYQTVTILHWTVRPPFTWQRKVLYPISYPVTISEMFSSKRKNSTLCLMFES